MRKKIIKINAANERSPKDKPSPVCSFDHLTALLDCLRESTLKTEQYSKSPISISDHHKSAVNTLRLQAIKKNRDLPASFQQFN